jgi:acyl-CoA thioester hydrolase
LTALERPDHPEIAALLADYPVVITVPIWWGDQDAFGHVNNTVYLRWFESARIAYCTRVGLSDLFTAERIGPILAAIACNYRLPLFFPDTAFVGARVSRIGRSSLAVDHAVVTANGRALAADGTSTIVIFDYKGHRPHPVPDSIRRAIENLEGRSFPAPEPPPGPNCA